MRPDLSNTTRDLQIIFIQVGELHERSKQTELQRAILVNRDNQPLSPSGHREDVGASVNSGERPAFFLNYPYQLFSRDLLHRASSMTLSWSPNSPSGVSTESQPSTASLKLAVISSIVSPCVTQLGKPGTSAQNPPSSATCTIALRITSE
jgi:hypothetical protein